MTARRPATVPHPGMACCDPTQDLAGWITRERARINRNYRWTRVLHQRGRRLDRASLRALVAGDQKRAEQLAAESRRAHGRANCYAQSALMAEGHVDRVEAAHAYRLQPPPAADPQLDLFGEAA